MIFSGNNPDMTKNEYIISLMKLGPDSHYKVNEIPQFADENKSYPVSIEPINFNQNFVNMITK